MKIAITGTRSTGKTTFLGKLEEAIFERFGYKSGRTTGFERSGEFCFPYHRDLTLEKAVWIIAGGMRQELELSRREAIVLVERPALETLGYLRAAYRLRGDLIHGPQMKFLEELTKASIELCYLMIVTELDPCIRWEGSADDKELRRAASEEIEKLLELLVPGALRLTSHNSSVVLQQVLSKLSDVL